MDRFVTLWGIAAIFVFGASPTHNRGLVEGVLVDEYGRQVADASIRAYPMEGGTHAPGAGTDANGAFSIGGLQWGKYAIGAKKESENYANTYDGFSAGDTLPPLVELSRAHPKAKVTLQFHGKAGVLVLLVADPQRKVLFACAELARASDPSKSLTSFVTDMNRRFLIPADTDVRVRFWLADYLPWSASTGRGTAGSEVIRLKPSEQRVFTVTLVPDPAARNRTEDDHMLNVRRMVEAGCAPGP